MKPKALFLTLLLLSAVLLLMGLAAGSRGWEVNAGIFGDMSSPMDKLVSQQILWQIRAPRSLGAWLAGGLLGLAGVIAQGLFRNPLADPYLLGSAAGAQLAVAITLTLFTLSPAIDAWVFRIGLTGAAFLGALLAVLLTLTLAKGVQYSLRLLLAGVIVGVVLAALSSLAMLMTPDIMRATQGFMLGTTAFLNWGSNVVLGSSVLVCGLLALGSAKSLDALALGETTARSLGLKLNYVRAVLVSVIAFATGAAVSQVGLIAFVGLVAPHMMRALVQTMHGWLLPLSALSGGILLLAADIAARWLLAPQELPVGVLTAVLGGTYLLWLMHRKAI